MTDKMRSFLKGLALGLAGKPLEFAPKKEPVAYLYNGVRLPKLPEWDKSKYPYAVLAYGTGESVPYWVYFCEKQPYINSDDEIVINEKTGGTLVSPTGTSAIYYRYYNFEGTVGWEDNPTATSLLSPIALEKTKVFWCSADILNTDGMVYLGGNIPLPVALFESGTWDFNGTKLPHLPTWDMTAYPYAYMGYTTITTSTGVYYRYYLYLTEQPFKIRASKTAAPDTDTAAQIYFTTPSSGEWKDEGTDTLTPSSVLWQPRWASYDIYYMDSVEDLGGTLYLSASEPVPVYE